MAQRASLGFAVLALALALLAGCGDGPVERVAILPGKGGAGDSGSDEHSKPPVDSGEPGDGATDAEPDAETDGGPSPCAGDAPCGEPVCGDGERTGDEACDDGDIAGGDGCDARCEIEPCPDGSLRRPDGTCRPPASGPECGNGVIEGASGEACEPALALEGTCDAVTCQLAPVCGNGAIEPEVDEECDPSDGIACVNCRIVDPPDPDGGVDAEVPCDPLPAPVVSIANGTFDTDVASWTARTRVAITRSAEGPAQAGSLRMVFEPLAGGDGGYEVSGAYQCVFVPPGAEYLLKLQYQVPASVPAGVSAMLMLRAYQNADCTGASTALDAPVLHGTRGSWTAREGTVSIGAEARALFVHLAVVKPRNVEGVVLWDDVVLQGDEDGARCGNCEVDDAQGEGCDDGNRAAGDGCTADCQLEGCGDGVINAAEDCDDGAQLFGDGSDTCTPGCRTKSACDACAATSCSLEIDPCLDLAGEAHDGPQAGAARAALCDALRECVHATGCAGDTAVSAGSGFGAGRFLEHCYCGAGGEACFDGAANGSCREEVEAALETTDPVTILSRVGGAQADFPIFAALKDLIACEEAQCATTCVTTPECGDGVKQDRTAELAATLKLRVGGVLVACDDALTHTGSGCSFEECDDGNGEGGDGCDASCFVEACGNNLKQADEECDDGNRISGDGCDADCAAEFVCGDGTRDERFEECDPPGAGPVCTAAQYEANPAQCGCDASCVRKVCGNGVLQEGEACDPPGPACSDTCELLEDRCTSCVRRIDIDQAASSGCGGGAWLEGTDDFPGFEQGCIHNEACYAAWTCYRTSLCALTAPFRSAHVCYCGEVAPEVCTGATYQPTGVCKDEIEAAFVDQFNYMPPNNMAVLEGWENAFDVPAGRYASFYVPYDLSQNCLGPTDDPALLRGRLLGNGLSETEAAECVEACFPDL